MLNNRKPFLQRDKLYKIPGVNYYRTYKLRGNEPYINGLLYIPPYADVRITVISFPNDYEVHIMVEKYDSVGVKTSIFYGEINKSDLLNILVFES